MYKYSFIFLIFVSFAIFAASDIEVMALFKDKAIVNIDNKQHLLKVGDPTKQGVKLIQATSKYAILEVDGKQSKYILGNRVQATYKKREKKKIQVFRDRQGLFTTSGFINGHTVDFLVDTGASAIAINSNLARQIGIQYKLKGDITSVSTASGTVPGYSLVLKEVKVGDIALKNVRALIIEGNSPEMPLLGMTYLGQLNIKNEGQVMTIEEKF